MNKQTFKSIAFALLALFLFQCNTDLAKESVEKETSDSFKNTIVSSQTFEIDSKKDTIIEGENGTLLVFPKGCFKNAKGEIVEGNVKIELSEALSLEDMLLSNLTTTSEGKPLETDGMIYYKATANGEQLTINNEIPIHIEIPTIKKKAGMMAYEGIRDEKGNMNWIEPKELDDFLVTVDINSLNFLPLGFQSEVDKGMPYKKHNTATQALTDSLYYILSGNNGSYLTRGLTQTRINEPYNDKNISTDYKETDTILKSKKCGINPAKIKVIKSDKYQNTLIATREFETRLSVIFKTCDNSLLDIYVKNLDKNLYEIDSIAAVKTKNNQYFHDFVNFSKLRLKKVKNADKFALLLRGYFEKQLSSVEQELKNKQKEAIKELSKKNKEVEKIVKEYKKLLFKREKIRMEKYGFNWTKTGWVNIDNGVLPKDWCNQSLEVKIENGKQFERTYTYLIFTSLKSLYRLNTSDNEQFFVGNITDRQILMPKNKLAVVIAIGYKNEIPSIAVKEFTIGEELTFSLNLYPSSIDKLTDTVRFYNKYTGDKTISNDLEVMSKFYLEEQRQKELKKESEFILRLYNLAYPCCMTKEMSLKSDSFD